MEINKKPFLELIKKYRSITIAEIQAIKDSGVSGFNIIAMHLTGFGGSTSCILCRAFDHRCKYCYGIETYFNEVIMKEHRAQFGCLHNDHEKTYYRIKNAGTVDDLLNAFQARVDHIEKWLEKFEEEK